MAERSAVPALAIDVERFDGDVAVVRCRGRLVGGATNLLYARVDALMPETQRVVLDLSGLEYTDSLGLGTLARLYVTAKAAGCTLELLHLSKQVRSLLGLTNMLGVLPVIGEDSLEFG